MDEHGPVTVDHERFDREILTPLRVLLKGTARSAREYGERHAWRADDDAQAMVELTGPEWSDRDGVESPLRSLHWAAFLQVITTFDYLRSLAVLLEDEHVTPQGYVPTARAAVETAARAWWLLDTDQPPKVRAARLLADRAHTVTLQARLPASVPRGDPVARWAQIAETCDTFGIPCRTKGDKVTAVGDERRPARTALVRKMFAQGDDEGLGAALYAVLSGPVHGEPAALLRAMRHGDETGDGRQALELAVEQWRVENVTVAALSAFEAAWQRWVGWFGWTDPDGWPGWRRHLAGKVAAIMHRGQRDLATPQRDP